MIANYLYIAFRNMTRNLRFTMLHLAGLSIGLASVILIAWYVYDELSFDNLPNAENVYRVNTYWGDDARSDRYATTPPPLAGAIRAEIPEVDQVARAFNWNHSTMRLPAEETPGKDEVVFRETRIFIVDPAFLEVVEYPIIVGDRKTILERPESIVITKETALRYFGEQALKDGKVLGKSILFGGDRTARIVTGVVNPPANTHLHFDMLVNVNFGYTELDTMQAWTWNIMHTYVKVNAKQTDTKALQTKLSAIAARQIHTAPDAENIKAADFRLQPLRDIHLHSALLREHEPNGDFVTVQLLLTIASLILILACANFVNLFTAQSVRRSKEVGVRKTLGSLRSSLTIQFFIESGLYTVVAAFFALSAAELLRRPFNELSGKHLEFNWSDHPVFIVGMIAAFMIVVLLSSLYPAFYLSSFNPVRALKGKLSQGNNFLRNGLVVFQFSISIGLMICSIFILQQLNFIQSRTPGYDRENVVVVKNGEIQEKWRVFRNELESHADIASVSFNTGLPALPMNTMRDFRRKGEIIGTGINLFLTDEHYLKALDIKLKSGSNFSDDAMQNENRVLINETAAKILGVKNTGEVIVLNYGDPDEKQLEVLGIVQDFNVESIHNNMKPLVLYYYSPIFALDYIAVRIKPGRPDAAVAVIEEAWKKFEPEDPFEYSFLDKDFERQYLSETRLSRLFGAFTILAVTIALLGLTGLASFLAEQRTKEIGIRKVLGATVTSIIVLFAGDFTKLAAIAIVIAVPASYLILNGWLSDFAYHIELQPVVFLLCCLTSVVLMWSTVGLLSLRVAKLNPANTLKTE